MRRAELSLRRRHGPRCRHERCRVAQRRSMPRERKTADGQGDLSRVTRRAGRERCEAAEMPRALRATIDDERLSECHVIDARVTAGSFARPRDAHDFGDQRSSVAPSAAVAIYRFRYCRLLPAPLGRDYFWGRCGDGMQLRFHG